MVDGIGEGKLLTKGLEDATGNVFDKLGTHGHFPSTNLVDIYVVYSLVQVVTPCTRGKVDPHFDVDEVFLSDDSFFRKAAMVGKEALPEDVDSVTGHAWVRCCAIRAMPVLRRSRVASLPRKAVKANMEGPPPSPVRAIR